MAELLALLTDAEMSLSKTKQEIRELRLQNSEDNQAESALAHKSTQWNPAQMQTRLERMWDELKLKSNDRIAMLDETGAILPPHHSAPNQWTKSPPVGKTERLRCLSAGPSPNRAAAMRSKGYMAGKGEIKTPSPAVGSNAPHSNLERLRLAWEAIVHATGVESEEGITGRLLEHSAERGQLSDTVSGLEVQRAALRRDAQNWHRQLQEVLHGTGSSGLRSQTSVLDVPDGRQKPKSGHPQQGKQRTQLQDAEMRLHSTEARLRTWHTLLAAVGPGIKHLANSCRPSVLSDLGVSIRDVTSEDDEASILQMVEARLCFVIEAAGLNVEHEAFGKVQLNASDRSGRSARSKAKGKSKGRGNSHANVRVPSRAMLELRVSGEVDGAEYGRA
jgi:hypothetical protein